VDDVEFDYVIGQKRDSFPALLASYDEESARLALREDALLDRRYGPLERQRLDFFPAAGTARATLAWFHAGYWQMRDKATFRFIADAFNKAGLHVALVNYPLCPTVTVAELLQAAAEAVPELNALGAGLPLILAGHSAGGQIVVELAMMKRPDWPDIKGIAAISGVFDLRPLVSTTLNDKLKLDEPGARAVSPVLHAAPNAPPALFAVGGAETTAFLQQTEAMAAAWSGVGNGCRHLVVEGADHFSILRPLTDPQHPLHRAVLELA
jgi:arylformamidase